MLTGRVLTVWEPDGLQMQIVEPFAFTDAAGRVWPVPAGFVTDGASIPRALWSIVGSPFTGAYRVAGVLHDSAYSQLGVTKNDADNMLREAAMDSGCEWWLAESIYAGVRVGGLGPYSESQREAANIKGST